MTRLRDNSGATLMELICAVLIVAMIAGTIAAGVGIGVKVQRQSRFAAESRRYAETMRAALEDLLHYAVYEGTEKDAVRFSCPGREIAAGELLLSEGTLVCVDRVSEERFALLSPSLYPELRITAFSLVWEEETGVFAGSFTIAGDRLAGRETEFAIRPVYGG